MPHSAEPVEEQIAEVRKSVILDVAVLQLG
jgi:hypothetical protein